MKVKYFVFLLFPFLATASQLIDKNEFDLDPSPELTDEDRVLPQELITPFTEKIEGRLEKAHDESFNKNKTEGVSCADILSNNIKTPNDGRVNTIMKYAYTLCMMEFVMQQYVKSQKTLTESDKTLLADVKVSLFKLRKIIPAYLNAYQIAYDAFKKDNLNDILNDARSNYDETKSY